MRVAHLVYNLRPAQVVSLRELCTKYSVQWTVLLLDRSPFYTQWDPDAGGGGVAYKELSWNGLRQCGIVWRALSSLRPETVILGGYRERCFAEAILWAKFHNRQAFLHLDSTLYDRARPWYIECGKKVLFKLFDGLIVPGARSAEYARRLGVPKGRISLVPYVVDNEFYSLKVAEIRERREAWRERLVLPHKYFIYVGRFSPEKNLNGLVEAYWRYRNTGSRPPWGLVLVGSGQLEGELRRKAQSLNLDDVTFVGFKRIEELPEYYGLAGCLILPSRSEPWGQVVNEAMACGLPMIVSRRCGCIPELVHEGRNGFVFDPDKNTQLVSLMVKVGSGMVDLETMGKKSKQLISHFTPSVWASRMAGTLGLHIS